MGDDQTEDNESVFYGDSRAQPRFKNRQKGRFGNPGLPRSRSGLVANILNHVATPGNPGMPRGFELRQMLDGSMQDVICFRCKKPGHRWRKCSNPTECVLSSTKSHLLNNPTKSVYLASILVANCDDAYYIDEESQEAEQKKKKADKSDSDSVVDGQCDAIEEVFAVFERHNNDAYFRSALN